MSRLDLAFTTISTVLDTHGWPLPMDALNLEQSCEQRVVIERIALKQQSLTVMSLSLIMVTGALASNFLSCEAFNSIIIKRCLGTI